MRRRRCRREDDAPWQAVLELHALSGLRLVGLGSSDGGPVPELSVPIAGDQEHQSTRRVHQVPGLQQRVHAGRAGSLRAGSAGVIARCDQTGSQADVQEEADGEEREGCEGREGRGTGEKGRTGKEGCRKEDSCEESRSGKEGCWEEGSGEEGCTREKGCSQEIR